MNSSQEEQFHNFMFEEYSLNSFHGNDISQSARGIDETFSDFSSPRLDHLSSSVSDTMSENVFDQLDMDMWSPSYHTEYISDHTHLGHRLTHDTLSPYDYAEYTRLWMMTTMGDPSSSTASTSHYDSIPRSALASNFDDHHFSGFGGTPISSPGLVIHGRLPFQDQPYRAHNPPTVAPNNVHYSPAHSQQPFRQNQQILHSVEALPFRPLESSYTHVPPPQHLSIPSDEDTYSSVEAANTSLEGSSAPSNPHEDADNDPDYTTTKSKKAGRPKARRTSFKTNGVIKKRSPSSGNIHVNLNHAVIETAAANINLRPFPCMLRPYGCKSTFTSKNEWKRHIETKHICTDVYHCKLCGDWESRPNIFNRKDLFSQHLKRMHPHGEASKANPNTKSNGKHQSLKPWSEETIYDDCHIHNRDAPHRLACTFCPQYFEGATDSCEKWLEHVGRHLTDNAKASVDSNPARYDITWLNDKLFKTWLVQEGLLVPQAGRLVIPQSNKGPAAYTKRTLRGCTEEDDAEGEEA